VRPWLAGPLQVGGDDVTELHFKYYPDQEAHPSFAGDVL
jgi:hypothetical protein